MAKYFYDIDQNSEAWERARMGIPTASAFDKILTPTGKPSKQWKDYAYHLLAEKCLDRPVDSYKSPWMERGNLLEGDAVSWYENIHCDGKVQAKEVGFVTTDDGLIGCSPDRLIGDDGLIEIKCSSPKVQIKYLLEGKLDDDHKPQTMGQLYVTGRQWVDVISFHPELPRCVIRVEREDAFIACLDAQLTEFNEYLLTCWEKIKELATVLDKGQYTLAG